MFAAVKPDTFWTEPMKLLIALAKLLLPALAARLLVPIMPPIAIEIGLVPLLPSRTPSLASFIIAVTMLDEELKPSVCADWDIAASVMP